MTWLSTQQLKICSEVWITAHVLLVVLYLLKLHNNTSFQDALTGCVFFALMSTFYSVILTVGVWEIASHPKLYRSASGIKIKSLTSLSAIHQAFLFHLRKTLAVWTQLCQLWQTAVVSTVLFIWTWWVMASRPSTVQDVALKCPMVCSISKELRPFRYSLSL